MFCSLFAQAFATPPPDTDWFSLVAAGTAYVFAIVALLRRQAPKLDGWIVPVAVVPVVAVGVAAYQVGFEDVRLLGKHAGLLYLGAYGGAAGARKLGSWALEAVKAAMVDGSIPPPPSLVPPSDPGNVVEIPKSPKAPRFLSPPPSVAMLGAFLALLLGLAMLTGCGAVNPCVLAYDKAETHADIEAVDAVCGAFVEGGIGGQGGSGGQGGGQ